MPAKDANTGGTRYKVEILPWTEEECRQWVLAFSKLCIESYYDQKSNNNEGTGCTEGNTENSEITVKEVKKQVNNRTVHNMSRKIQ